MSKQSRRYLRADSKKWCSRQTKRDGCWAWVGVAPENNWVVDMTVAVAVGWEIDTGYPSGKRI